MTRTPQEHTVLSGSPEVEKFLKHHHAIANLRLIHMASVNERESLRNQARAEALDEDHVEDLYVAARNGAVFPPVIVYQLGEKYVIVDGNHRYAACKRASRRELPTYVLMPDTPSEVITKLTFAANVGHGKPTASRYRIHQAAQLLSMGFTVDDVSRSLCLHKSNVNVARRAVQADQRGAKLNIKGWDDLPVGQKALLNEVTDNDLFASLAELAIQTDWSPNPAYRSLVKQTQRAHSVAEAMAIVGTAWEQRKAEQDAARAMGKTHSRISNPKSRFLTAFGSVVHLEPSQAGRVFLTNRELQLAKERAEEAGERIFEVIEVLDKRLAAGGDDQ